MTILCLAKDAVWRVDLTDETPARRLAWLEAQQRLDRGVRQEVAGVYVVWVRPADGPALGEP